MSSSDRVVSIVAPAGGRKNFVTLDVPIKNLATYSVVAKHHYFPGNDSRDAGGQKRNLSNGTEFDLGEGIDEDFARTIAAFIKKANPAQPSLITLSLFGEDLSIEELVKIWRAIDHGFKVPRHLIDDSIRGTLRSKIYKTTPYTLADFRLICDDLDFDRGLVNSAMDRATFLHAKGYLDNSAKEDIEEYCKSKNGHWDSLLETLGKVVEKIDDAAQKKANRERQQQSKAGPSKSAPKGTNNKAKPKTCSSQQPKAPSAGNINNVPREGPQATTTTDNTKSSGNKGKGKGKAKVAPFVRKDDDFPPLA
jgi:hypothetical protein